MLRLFVLALVLLVSHTLVAAERSAAELFPIDTRAYVELRQPAALAETLQRWVQGTALENGLKLLHDRRDAMTDPRLMMGESWLHSLITVTSPEMFAELRKLRGVAIGYSGLTEQHLPKVALVILPGESVALSWYLRAMIVNNPELRRIDTLHSVPILQLRTPPTAALFNPMVEAQPLKAEKAKEGSDEWTVAFAPGLFVVGSNKLAVVDVLNRWHTPAPTSVLDEPTWKSDRTNPGVWGFVRPTALVADADRLRKVNPDALDAEILALAKLTLAAKTLSIITSEVRVASDELTLKIQANRDRSTASPLLDLFTGPLGTVPLANLHAKDGASITIAIPQEDRLAKLTRFADSIAKAHGVAGALPSEQLPQVEQTTGVRMRDELLPKLDGVSVHWPSSATATSWPIVTVHAANASDWIGAVPKLAHGFGWSAEPPTPSRETISGILVTSAMVGSRALHSVAHSHGVSFGTDREMVLMSANRFVTTAQSSAKLSPHAIRGTVTPLSLVRFPHWPRFEQPPMPMDVVAVNTFSPSESDWRASLGPLPTIVCDAAAKEDRATIEFRWNTANQRRAIVDHLIPLFEKLGIPTWLSIPNSLPALRR